MGKQQQTKKQRPAKHHHWRLGFFGVVSVLVVAPVMSWWICTTVFPEPRIGLRTFILTLVHWHSTTVWHTGQSLPAVATWHILAAIFSLISLVEASAIFGLVSTKTIIRHSSPKHKTGNLSKSAPRLATSAR